MVCMRYGSKLGTFGEHRHSSNAPKCIGMHLVHLESVYAFGERLCAINMVCMRYGNALAILGAFGEYLSSPNVPNALPKRVRTIFMVRLR